MRHGTFDRGWRGGALSRRNFPETIKRRLGVRRISFAHMGIAVMVAGNGKNQSRIILIRLIELGFV